MLNKIKYALFFAWNIIMLGIFAAGWQGYDKVLPAECLHEVGVYEFAPTKIYSTNRSDGYAYSQKHSPSAKQSYILHYKALNGAPYNIKRRFSYKSQALKAKQQGNIVRRLVEGTDEQGKIHSYVLEPQESISSMVREHKLYYGMLLNVPIAYFIFLALYGYLRYSRRNQ